MYAEETIVSPSFNRWDSRWQALLFLAGRRLQINELVEVQQVAAYRISSAIPYILGNFQILNGLKVSLMGDQIYVSAGRVGLEVSQAWRVIYTPTFILPYQDGLYIGLLVKEGQEESGPDPILGGPTLSNPGGLIDSISVNVTTRKGSGYPIAYVRGQEVISYYGTSPIESNLNSLQRRLRQRLWEEVGDFIYKGLKVYPIQDRLVITPGVAYIEGRRVSVSVPTSLPLMDGTVVLTQLGEIEYERTLMGETPALGTPKVRTEAGFIKHPRAGLPILKRLPYSFKGVGSNPLVPLCKVESGQVLDSSFYLPSPKEVYEAYERLLRLSGRPTSIIEPDPFHPLFNAYISKGYISLGRFESQIRIGTWTFPHTQKLSAYQHRISETNLVPTTRTPFLFQREGRLVGVNLPPNFKARLTVRGKVTTPQGVSLGTVEADELVATSGGQIDIELPSPLVMYGPYGLSEKPEADRGLGQWFSLEQPLMAMSVRLYADSDLKGLVILKQVMDGIPVGDALGWGVVDSNVRGWIDINVTPTYLSGTVGIIYTTPVEETYLGAYTPGIEFQGEGESISSRSLTSSVDGRWSPIRNRDLACELLTAKVVSSYSEWTTTVTNVEPFDGIDGNLNLHTPPGTSLVPLWFRGEEIIPDKEAIRPTNQVSLKVIATSNLVGVPQLLPSTLTLWTTRRSSTWVSKEQFVDYPFTQVFLHVDVQLPEGTEVTFFISVGGGPVWIPMGQVITGIYKTVFPIPQTSIRVRIDISTRRADIRPKVNIISLNYI